MGILADTPYHINCMTVLSEFVVETEPNKMPICSLLTLCCTYSSFSYLGCYFLSNHNHWSYFFLLRYQQRSAVKLASCITTASSADITALSAISDFFSCILFLLSFFLQQLLCGGQSEPIPYLVLHRASRWTTSMLTAAHQSVLHKVFTCCLRASTTTCKSCRCL